jgi:hypothetical protein
VLSTARLRVRESTQRGRRREAHSEADAERHIQRHSETQRGTCRGTQRGTLRGTHDVITRRTSASAAASSCSMVPALSSSST